MNGPFYWNNSGPWYGPHYDPTGRSQFVKEQAARTKQYNDACLASIAASRAARQPVFYDPPRSSSHGSTTYRARRTSRGTLFLLGIGIYALGAILLYLA